MSATRRTALAMLGFVPASAVGAETFMPPAEKPGEIRSVIGAYDGERFAKAFENLVAELRRGAVEIQSLKFTSDLEANAIADVHQIVLRFHYRPEV